MPEGISARKGVNYILFMKLTAVVIAVLLTLFARGVNPALAMAIVVGPLWWLAERIMDKTNSPSLWKSIEKREDFSRLPLAEDINKMKGAKKGQKVKQAILEGRLKDQVYYTLKNEYNLSGDEIEILSDDLESMAQKIDNEKLIEYLKKARDLNDLKKPKGEDQVELFSEEEYLGSEEGKFEEKIKSAVAELEKIHYVEEER